MLSMMLWPLPTALSVHENDHAIIITKRLVQQTRISQKFIMRISSKFVTPLIIPFSTYKKNLQLYENLKMVLGDMTPRHSGLPKLVNFYKTCLEWSFHSMKTQRTSKTRLCELPSPHFSNSRNLQVYFGRS